MKIDFEHITDVVGPAILLVGQICLGVSAIAVTLMLVRLAIE